MSSRFLLRSFLFLIILLARPSYARDVTPHSQIIVSLTGSWSNFHSTVFLFERKGDRWQRLGNGMPAVVGSLGLGWDPSATGKAPGEPVKREGDRKAPAGIFPIPLAMGFQPLPPQGTALPYRQIGDGTHCVDDSASPYYNRIVRVDDVPGGKVSWRSSERMWEMAEVYRLLLVVGYNTDAPKPGDGSCIFMHIRRPSGDPTYGCTALAGEDLARVMKWLESDKDPALVQLPRDVYERVWQNWGLPSPVLLEGMGSAKALPLVNVLSVAPDVALDMRYAGSDNFTGQRIYDCGRCYLRPETAAKVASAQRELNKLGLSLKMWDCYRPLAAQRLFWSLVPDPRYVADPKTGSRHNRGNAVDVTLLDTEGKELEMPTGFDDFTPRAGHGERDLPAKAIANRRLLWETMERAGFKRLESEWWHYDDAESGGEIIDVPFSDLCM